MVAVRALAWAELRRSWRPLVLLALVVAVGGGSVMVTVAGARRADSSYSRFRGATVDGNLFVGSDDPARLAELGALREVEALAPFGYAPIYPVGAPTEARDEGGAFASLDGRWLYDVARPRVLDGVMPAADTGSKMAVNEELARWFDVDVGDTVPMEATTRAAMASDGEREEVTHVELEVAAIVRTPMDVGVNVGGPIAYLPPGVIRAHDIGVVEGFALVRLVGGDGAISAFDAMIAERFDGAFFTSSLVDEGRTVERANDVQVNALLAAGAIAALTTIALVVQVGTRELRRTSGTSSALRSLGATRAQRATALALPLVAAALVGIAIAMGAAIVLSTHLPRGLARLVEPDPGVRIDGTAIAAVASIFSVVIAVIAVALADRAGAPPARDPLAAPRMAERATVMVQRRGANLRFLTGLRLAMPAGPAGERRNGVAAYLGLIVGIAGLVVVATFAVEIRRLGEDSAPWGTPFELVLGGVDEEIAREVARVPGVARVTAQQFAEEVDLGGTRAPAFALDPVEGELLLTTVDGRAPGATGEVVLGVRTAKEIGLRVGDTLPAPDGESADMLVVGLGLLPLIGDNAYDSGVVLWGRDLSPFGDLEPAPAALVGLAEGADAREVIASLEELGVRPSLASPPGEQLNLRATDAYPRLVAVLVALLAMAGLISAMASGVHGRRLELALLRAIGLTPAEIRSGVRWQAVTASAIGLVVALPLGFIGARAAWTAFARTLSIDDAFAAPWVVIGAVTLGCSVVAVGVALPIGRRWSGRPLSDDLRAA